MAFMNLMEKSMISYRDLTRDVARLLHAPTVLCISRVVSVSLPKPPVFVQLVAGNHGTYTLELSSDLRDCLTRV